VGLGGTGSPEKKNQEDATLAAGSTISAGKGTKKAEGGGRLQNDHPLKRRHEG